MTVTVNTGIVQGADEDPSWTIDQLARICDVPSRTIREYRTLGVLPPPVKRGRIAIYGTEHVRRLRVIGRLQARGYSLAGIRDLLESWQDGDDLGALLGLTTSVFAHDEEPGAQASGEELARFLPEVVPERLDDLVAAGALEECGRGEYCVVSPSLMQLTHDALAAGYPSDAVVRLIGRIGRAAEDIADAVATETTPRPPGTSADELIAFATRARGLLAHGTGRLTVHAIGKRLGIEDDATTEDRLRQHWNGQE
jgi:DNA-binding transcriptional MerR regulator